MSASITADRGFTWSDEETSLLLQLWGGNDAQSELTGNKRNFVVYGKISETMNGMGYFRTASQCREKIKRMKREYTLTKQHNESGVGNKKNMRFYEQFEKILLEKQKKNQKNTTLKPCPNNEEIESEIDESDKKTAAPSRFDPKQRTTPTKSNKRKVKEMHESLEKDLDTPWTPDVLLVEDTPNPVLMDNHSIASTSTMNDTQFKGKKRRHEKKVFSFETILCDLQGKKFIDETSKDILELSLTGVSKSMLEKLQNPRSGETFPDELKSFVLTLYFYSAEAYDYIRKKYSFNLPDPVTLQHWNSSSDGSPGFSTTGLNACKQKVLEASTNGKTVQCALLVDEMRIKRDIRFDGHRYTGWIDYGTGLDDDQLPAARDAYTFLLNCINDHWKVPIAYFFIDDLSANARANLISLSLKRIHETGIEVVSVTLDGSWRRLLSTQCLGGHIEDFDYTKPHFKHPVTKNPVQVIIDPSFLIQSLMVTLASSSFLVDVHGGIIKFEYIVALEKLQKQNAVLLPSKLRKKCVELNSKKNKLAIQVMSASVVGALSYLAHDAKIPEFENCDATIEFLKCFYALFDVLYSQNCFSKNLNAPLSVSNKEYIFKFLDYAESYIKNLRTAVDGPLLINSSRKTAVLGFLTCIYSVKELYNNLIENRKFEYISMYKFSQDNLKLFFGAIRSRTGLNDDDPTTKMFSTVFKDLVCRDDTCSLSNIYCTHSDRTKVSKISSSVNYYIYSINKSYPLGIEISENGGNRIDLTNFHKLKPIVGDIIIYVASHVVRKVIKALRCPTCILALLYKKENCMPIDCENGGLIIPGRDVIHLCRVAERIIRVLKFEKTLEVPIIIEKIITLSMRDMFPTTFSFLNYHIKSQDMIENHKILLCKSVIFEFLKIRLNQVISCYEFNSFEEVESFETTKFKIKKYWASVLKNEKIF